ncbi:unnamed protein product [Rhizophagus irregularis]|nr:unnamed protein product [Rhizophagus irregularis]CAB4424175.1 unnamed protein product [Rhizophagus irregularis]CAB5343059.1 unnamed protein product [Rhizophagus irregularis]
MTDNTDSSNVMSSSEKKEKKGLLETLGKDIEIIKKRLQSITQEKESFKRRCTELEKKNRELSCKNVELQRQLDSSVKENESQNSDDYQKLNLLTREVKDILGMMNAGDDDLGGNEREGGSNATGTSVSKEIVVEDENFPNDEGQDSDYTDECVVVPIDQKKSTDSKHNHSKSTPDTPGQNTHVYCEYCNKYITSKGYKNHLYTQIHLSNVSVREKEE